ncbi:MAG: phage tail assembly chaperone [Phycisphaerales bacterium]|nr:phage tail assembly chaperone [Hyphomonadaceae bacterium]
MVERTPWPALLAAAMRAGVAPRDFWRLSLKEWRALVAPTEAGLSRAAFEAMAQVFPDKTK